MNSLEALHNFIATKSCINCPCHEKCDEGVDCPCDEWERIIKQDLERLEQLEEEYKKYQKLSIEVRNNFLKCMRILNEENEKLKQAIDILKRFNFTIFNTKDNNNELAFRIYTDSLLETQPLNKQEYNLLKEVLDNE